MTEAQTIFDRLDAASKRSYHGFSPFNILSNIRVWRIYIALLVVSSAILWALLGFDSTWEVAEIYVMAFSANPTVVITGFINKTPDYLKLQTEAFATYGMGNHWSAPVIYGTFFILTSYALEKRGYFKSANFVLTSLLSFGAIGSFEIPWNFFYATFQCQRWAFDFFHMKQMALLWSFSVFTLLGVLAFIYILLDGHKLSIKLSTALLIFLTIGMWTLWINYPYPTETITVYNSGAVDLGGGPLMHFDYAWQSSKMFPQTYYAVDVNPFDGVSSGMPYYVQNDLLHAVNTLTKIIHTAAIFSLIKVKKKL